MSTKDRTRVDGSARLVSERLTAAARPKAPERPKYGPTGGGGRMFGRPGRWRSHSTSCPR